ncbi:MAG: hypothetical protein VCD00_20980, partial [Candidatus Hydrogenedentota bacterium]
MKARKRQRIPSLRENNNRGFVELNGRRIYLGPSGAAETQVAYDRAISEWLANRKVESVAKEVVTISEICRDYWLHCEEYYRLPNGKPSSSLDILRQALKPLVTMYGDSTASDFGPLSLRGIRDEWIENGLTRETVNKYTAALRRMFKWAASHERLDISVYQSICTVENLAAGRSKARESVPQLPVPESHIHALEPFLSSQVWALINLQLLTGTRAGELLRLRPCDLGPNPLTES